MKYYLGIDQGTTGTTALVFNEEWIEEANPLEIQVVCFHETRHAFQYECIDGTYKGKEKVDSETIKIWKQEMSNYNQPTKKDISEEEYLKQSIEIDAIAFAHYQMKRLFNAESVIPEIIKDEVNALIKEKYMK